VETFFSAEEVTGLAIGPMIINLIAIFVYFLKTGYCEPKNTGRILARNGVKGIL